MNHDQHHDRPRLVKLSGNADFLQVLGFNPDAFLNLPLYLRGEDSFRLVKPAGEAWDPPSHGRLDDVFIMSDDKERAIALIQKAMVEGQLKALLRGGEIAQAKLALTCLLGEAFSDPRLRTLQGLRGVAETMVEELAEDNALAQAFLMVGSRSYGLAEHGVNVMALLLGLARKVHKAKEGLVEMALAAMLHDVGKTHLPTELHQPARPLTDQEYALVKSHPDLGAAIVTERGLGQIVLQGVTQHHERLDGSGYPRGARQVSLAGQLVGLANSYEALTNPVPERPRRLSAIETLSLLKGEVDQGKHDPALFEAFAYSLTR